MRTFALMLFAVTSPSVILPQEPAPRPVLVDDVPQGTNWVANARTRIYYRVGCPITASIPAADKLYYKDETSLQKVGFTRSDDCDVSGAANASPGPTATTAVSPPSATAAGTPGPTQGEQKHRRTGFWFNGGLGYGSLGCQNCAGRDGSVTGGLALGGTVSQKVLLGAATTAWWKSEGGSEFDVGTLVAVIRFYPSATGGFFLLGGLGLGSIHVERAFSAPGIPAESSEAGFGALVGLGYDGRVGKNVSLTPFWNGFAVNTDNSDANVGQIGLGVTIH